jgi:hypothetical protein
MKSRGVIYVAIGSKHANEAYLSARSVQRTMPGIPMTLFTDQVPPHGLFENVIKIEDAKLGFACKIRPMAMSPYEETLFLDTDTFMCNPCEDIFWPLQRHDIAIAHEVYRNEYSFESFPGSFPSLNTGVIVFRKNDKTTGFFKSWEENHLNYFLYKRSEDQPSFRHTLFNSNLSHYILPAEYNFRTNYPIVLGGFAKAMIIHDRSPNLDRLAERLGKSTSHPPIYFGPFNAGFVTAWYSLRIRTLLIRARGLGLSALFSRLKVITVNAFRRVEKTNSLE